jgi:microcompartment protein CcmK/EutM
MRLARITGTITATVKDPQLAGKPLLVADVVDAAGKVIDASVVAADLVGAGGGETVLLAQGSAARLPGATAGAPVDTAIIAIVDAVQDGPKKR